MKLVTVLFTHARSCYRSLPAVDPWPADRDATRWAGGSVVIAHPPCGPWGRLRRFSKASQEEIDLGPWAVEAVRAWGGVLEHPSYSTLWAACEMPRPGGTDRWGGVTWPVVQHWFGHKAEKKTWLYVVGCSPKDFPPVPLTLEAPAFVIQTSKTKDPRPHVPRAERELTPLPFATWLVALARKCQLDPATAAHRQNNWRATVRNRAATPPSPHANTMEIEPTLTAADAAFNLHVESPLHHRPAKEILRVLFEEHGTAAAPSQMPGPPKKSTPQRFQIGFSVRYYTAEDMQFLLEDLHAELQKQCPEE